MKKNKLSNEQAYLAMFSFLESYYERGKSDEIGGMLSDMSLLEDDGTADPAIKEDWDDAVEKALNGKVDAKLRFIE